MGRLSERRSRRINGFFQAPGDSVLSNGAQSGKRMSLLGDRPSTNQLVECNVWTGTVD